MNKLFVTLVICLMFGAALPAQADKEFVQKIMGKAETVQKKATAAQEKIMSYKKKMEEYAKMAKDAYNDAQGMVNDVKGAINDAQSMAAAVQKGDFSSLNVMPSELKTAMNDVKEMKKEVNSKVKEAKSMAEEAKATAQGASALASQAVSDAKGQVSNLGSTVSGTVNSATGKVSGLSSSSSNTAQKTTNYSAESSNLSNNTLKATSGAAINNNLASKTTNYNNGVSAPTISRTGATQLSNSGASKAVNTTSPTVNTATKSIGTGVLQNNMPVSLSRGTVAQQQFNQDTSTQGIADKGVAEIKTLSKEANVEEQVNPEIAGEIEEKPVVVRKAFSMPSGNEEIETPDELKLSIEKDVEAKQSSGMISAPTMKEGVILREQKSAPITKTNAPKEIKSLSEPAKLAPAKQKSLSAPLTGLQKNSFWLDEKTPTAMKIAQRETLSFADEASNDDPENVSEAMKETFSFKEGEGDSVEQAKEDQEKVQEYMRSEVTALYATGFSIRANMMKEPENRDVDMEAEDQMWNETILKAEDCITRIAKFHIMEAMLSSYKYSTALQEIVDKRSEDQESEAE